MSIGFYILLALIAAVLWFVSGSFEYCPSASLVRKIRSIGRVGPVGNKERFVLCVEPGKFSFDNMEREIYMLRKAIAKRQKSFEMILKIAVPDINSAREKEKIKLGLEKRFAGLTVIISE